MRPNRAILLIAAILLAALQMHAEKRGWSAMSETDSFHSSSATKVFKHPIRSPWTGVRFVTALTIDSGTADVRLVDDSGTTRWEKTFARGEQRIEQTFPGTGTWRIELHLHGAAGKYSVKLIGI